MKFKDSKILLTISTLTFLVLLGLVAFAVYEIEKRNKETAILVDEARRVSVTGGTIQAVKVIQSNAKEELEAFDELVLVGDKLVPLIDKIERSGRELGLETSTASVERIVGEGAEPDLIRLTIEADGSWSGGFAFLQALENLPTRVMISDSSLNRTGDGWHLKVVLLLHSFD